MTGAWINRRRRPWIGFCPFIIVGSGPRQVGAIRTRCVKVPGCRASRSIA
jgi:hypothetical protein